MTFSLHHSRTSPITTQACYYSVFFTGIQICNSIRQYAPTPNHNTGHFPLENCTLPCFPEGRTQPWPWMWHPPFPLCFHLDVSQDSVRKAWALLSAEGQRKYTRLCYWTIHSPPPQELRLVFPRLWTCASRQQDSRLSGLSLSSPRWAEVRWQHQADLRRIDGKPREK